MGPHQHKLLIGTCADGNLKDLDTQQSCVKLTYVLLHQAFLSLCVNGKNSRTC